MVDKSTRYAKSSPWYCPLSRSKLFSKALSLKKYVRLVRDSCASASAYKADDALPAYIRQNNISATRQRGLVLELIEKNNGEVTSSEVMDLLIKSTTIVKRYHLYQLAYIAGRELQESKEGK